MSIRENLNSMRLQSICQFFKQSQIIVIDEAQYIPNIGQAVKIAVDNCQPVKIIITGRHLLASIDKWENL